MSSQLSSQADTVVDVRDVWRSFQMGRAEVKAVRGVSLTVQRGDTVSIMGASGAGKSTLLHVMGGLEKPTQGSVFEGEDLYGGQAARRAAVRARRMGFVFQGYHLLPELDVLDNVLLPARSQPGAFARLGEHRLRAMSLLEEVGLADRADHRPYELSGGEQQRTALARALMNDPDIILADEPTGNLDSKTGDQVLDVLFALVAAQGKTLVMVTHDERVAVRCGRSLVLHDGRLAS